MERSEAQFPRRTAPGRFATVVQKLLESERLTQTMLASRLDLGTGFISRVLAGQRWPDLDAVTHWADVLRADSVELVHAWLYDRAPTAYDVLVHPADELWAKLDAEFGPTLFDLARRIRALNLPSYRMIEALVDYIMALERKENEHDRESRLRR